MTIEQLYTTKEVAEIFKVKDYTVREWINSGDLKAFKVKGYYRIKQSDLQDFADKQFEELG